MVLRGVSPHASEACEACKRAIEEVPAEEWTLTEPGKVFAKAVEMGAHEVQFPPGFESKLQW
jgi:hypothetical protein